MECIVSDPGIYLQLYSGENNRKIQLRTLTLSVTGVLSLVCCSVLLLCCCPLHERTDAHPPTTASSSPELPFPTRNTQKYPAVVTAALKWSCGFMAHRCKEKFGWISKRIYFKEIYRFIFHWNLECFLCEKQTRDETNQRAQAQTLRVWRENRVHKDSDCSLDQQMRYRAQLSEDEPLSCLCVRIKCLMLLICSKQSGTDNICLTDMTGKQREQADSMTNVQH